MARKINYEGLCSIKRFEGCRLTAYEDVGGVLTIGYGTTNATGLIHITPGMTITQEEADSLLLQSLTKYEECVENSVQVELADNQFAALVCFTYNVGIAAFQGSTLLKKLNQGNYECVPTELMKWVTVGGKKVQGLINRRAAEGGLWARGGFVSSNYVQPSSDNRSILGHAEMVAPAIGAASGMGSILSGYGPIQWAASFIMIASFALIVWKLLPQILENRK